MNQGTELIMSDADPRIIAAARGLRPFINDNHPLPSRFVKFAPSCPTYKVSSKGDGTKVILYGTTEKAHSICVVATGFRPYCFIELPKDFTYVKISALLEELNLRLLLILAKQQMQTNVGGFESNEIVAMREARAGYIEESAFGKNRKRLTIRDGKKHCAPIVGHEIVQALPLRGTGSQAGYQGMRVRPFLKIYFYCPSLVSKARSILQGIASELGAVGQAERLHRFRPKEDSGKADLEKSVGAGMHARRNQSSVANPKQRKLTTLLQRDPLDDDDEDSESCENDNRVEGDPLYEIAEKKRKKQVRKNIDTVETALDCLDDDSFGADDARDQPLLPQLEVAMTQVHIAYGSNGDDSDGEIAHDANGDGGGGGDDDDDTEDAIENGCRTFDVEYDELSAKRISLRKILAARFEKLVLADIAAVKTRMFNPGVVYDVFEADIDFVLRFAIDLGFSYCNWLTIDCDEELHTHPNGARAREPFHVRRVTGNKRESRVQIELACDYRLLHFDADDKIQNTMPQQLHISLDCEMAPGENGEFPDLQHNAMLQCAIIVRLKGLPKGQLLYREIIFTLGTLDCRVGKRENCKRRVLLPCVSEAVMFAAIAAFVRLADVEFVSGYNSDGFDLPYMLGRSEKLGLGKTFVRAWGRSRTSASMTVRLRTFQSAQAGKVTFTDVRAEGLTAIDAMKWLQRNPLIKLRSYSLNAVSETFLDGKQKEDVPYSMINELQQTAEGRWRLASYCSYDALLVFLVMENQQAMPGLNEMARVATCPIEMLLNRGQQVRAICSLYKMARAGDNLHLFYTRTDQERAHDMLNTFKGANVVKPRAGLYRKVFTLDQAALYPSIMRTFNFCFSTLVPRVDRLWNDPDIQGVAEPEKELPLEERKRRADAAVFVVPDTECAMPFRLGPFDGAPIFLKHAKKVGIIPMAQKMYSEKRAVAKAAMVAAEKAGDKTQEALLNQRQLAFKLLGNSLYGVVSSTTSRIYCPPVGESVTRCGRWLLDFMRSEVTIEFKQHGCEVIYGDTDSIFVRVHDTIPLEEAAKIGCGVAAHITVRMRAMFTTESPEYNVLKLEFEKIFDSIIFVSPKRYVGLKWVYSAKTQKLTPYADKPGVPIMSGLESNRRDTTLLISERLIDVAALLLSPDYSVQENLERAKKFTWAKLIDPVLMNTVNLRDLVVTKQLRKAAADYIDTADGRSLPVHVQLREKLAIRNGESNAPKAGARIPYVIVRGAMHEPVSSRGEDPLYALENGVALDSDYYLNSHIAPAIIRIVMPVFAGVNCQTQLVVNSKVIGTDLQFGKTDDARRKANETAARTFMFGHPVQFNRPYTAEELVEFAREVVPATRALEAIEKKYPRYLPRQRIEDTLMTGAATTGAVKQRTLARFISAGALCDGCKRFFPSRERGFVCTDCAEAGHSDSATKVRKYVLDIEELRDERELLATTCHDCMGCGDVPQQITCMNQDCRVLWDRKQNARSLIEAEQRMSAHYNNACENGEMERLSFF